MQLCLQGTGTCIIACSRQFLSEGSGWGKGCNDGSHGHQLGTMACV